MRLDRCSDSCGRASKLRDRKCGLDAHMHLPNVEFRDSGTAFFRRWPAVTLTGAYGTALDLHAYSNVYAISRDMIVGWSPLVGQDCDAEEEKENVLG